MAKPYHPPTLSAYLPPEGEHPDYIQGNTGPQGFGCRDFYVAQLPCKDSRAIIIRFHYSHRVVNNSYLHLGVYLEGALEGVLQFGYALQSARVGSIVEGTVQGEYMELNRMWVSDEAPRNSESRAISYAIKYIRRACPTVAWIQSFADERCKGLGVVYQAANFTYLGCHVTSFYELDGDYYHEMMVRRKNTKRALYLQANLDRTTRHSYRQFRYIFFLKKSWTRRLKLKVQPYPKPSAVG